MSFTITYFVHGTTTDNELGLATGWLPGELSERGVSQARELVEHIKKGKFAVVISSDLFRAVQTARLACSDVELLRQHAGLRECNYGDLNGTSAAAFKNHMTEYIDTKFPNGESYKDVETRMKNMLNELAKEFEGQQHIAFIAHQAPQLALEVICNGKTWEEAIATDWRKTHAYQAGWQYVYDEKLAL
jgi:broad specificity phosphatase PhoE